MKTTQILHAVLFGALILGGLAVSGCGDAAPVATSTTEKTTVIVPAAPPATPAKTDVSVTTNPAPAAPSPK